MSDDIRQLSDKVFSGLGPFTITITNPNDARMLAWSVVSTFCDNSQRLTQSALQMLIMSCEALGVEEGVACWYDTSCMTAEAHKKQPMPVWVKPMFVHIMTHIINKIEGEE